MKMERVVRRDINEYMKKKKTKATDKIHFKQFIVLLIKFIVMYI